MFASVNNLHQYETQGARKHNFLSHLFKLIMEFYKIKKLGMQDLEQSC